MSLYQDAKDAYASATAEAMLARAEKERADREERLRRFNVAFQEAFGEPIRDPQVTPCGKWQTRIDGLVFQSNGSEWRSLEYCVPCTECSNLYLWEIIPTTGAFCALGNAILRYEAAPGKCPDCRAAEIGVPA